MNHTNLFIYKAKEVHGDKYDYSLVRYVNATKNVKIICRKHGVFQQTPSSHLSGANCKFCARGRLTREEFLLKVNKIHANRYDYSKCEYSHTFRKLDSVTVTCPEHGDFYQRVDLHLKGHGCSECAGTKKISNKKSRHSAMEKTTGTLSNEKFILVAQYELKDNPLIIKIHSEPFQSKMEGEKHIEDIKMFLDIINGKIIESSIETIPVHQTRPSSKNGKIVRLFQKMIASFL